MLININENDNSSPTSVETFAGIPAAVIGTSKTGPAFVPQLVSSEVSFTETFGDISSDHWGSVAVRAWYNEAQANAGLVYLRVLGAGDGKKRTTNNRVNNAGFVVGSNNVRTEDDKLAGLSLSPSSAVTVGALALNPFANEVIPIATVATHAPIVDALVVGGEALNDAFTIMVPTILGGDGVTYTIVTKATNLGHGTDPDDTISYAGSGADSVRQANLILAFNGTSDATLAKAGGTNWSTSSGIPGITASAGTGATGVTLTLGTAGGTSVVLTETVDGAGTHPLVKSPTIFNEHFTGGRDASVSSSSPGRTYFLSTIMSESAGSTYLTDAGLTGTHDPILRAVILVASGVQLQVSGWRPGDSGASTLSGSAVAVNNVSGSHGNEDAGNWIGAYNSNSQSVKLILNGLKETKSRVIDFGLNPDENAYLSGINEDPSLFEEKGHYLYAHYPVPSTLAVPATTTNVIHGFNQAVDSVPVPHYHNVLLTTGSADRNTYGASGYKPNYEGWEDRFSTPFTPWVISQAVGGTETKLFRLHALDDGQGTEDQYFAEISNIIYPKEDSEYSTFDLTVRRYGDIANGSTTTFASPEDNSVLISYSNLTLDPSDSQYIARVIGDYHRYYNFDVNTNEQKLVLAGMYDNQNKYFRVEMAADVANGKTAKTLVPFGYQGVHHLVTSGSSEMLSDIQAGEKWYEPHLYGEAGHTDGYPILSGGFEGIGQGMLTPPVPFRTKNQNTPNETVYPWGIRFDNPTKGFLYTDATDSTAKSLTGNTQGSSADQLVNNSVNLWSSGKNLDLIRQLNKFYPSYSTSPMWVGDNAGKANSTNGAVLDSDEFNKNKFTLGRVYLAENAASNPDNDRWHQAHYIRSGVNPSTSGFRFLKAADLKSTAETQNYTKFVLPFQGGFDGLNIFDQNKLEMNHWAAHFEQENSSTQGGLLGPTVASYRKAIDIIAEKTDVDINVLAIPGQRSSFVTEYAANKMEERFDAIFVMDIELTDAYGSAVANIMFDGKPGQKIDSTRELNTENTIARFSGRGLKTSFSAAYYPNVDLNFRTNARTGGRVGQQDIGIGTSFASYSAAPASIAALAAFARTDRREGAWGTPAGYDNGRPAAIINTEQELTAADTKSLSVNSINPIVVYNDQVAPALIEATDLSVHGTAIVAGQRTLLNTDSALSRLDVRKLMVYIRRQTRNIAYKYIFEPNQSSVLSSFSREVENLLATLVTAGAVQQYRVVIDETTTSQADIENNTVRGKVFVQPYRSVEIIAIDINVNNSDQA